MFFAGFDWFLLSGYGFWRVWRGGWRGHYLWRFICCGNSGSLCWLWRGRFIRCRSRYGSGFGCQINGNRCGWLLRQWCHGVGPVNYPPQAGGTYSQRSQKGRRPAKESSRRIWRFWSCCQSAKDSQPPACWCGSSLSCGKRVAPLMAGAPEWELTRFPVLLPAPAGLPAPPGDNLRHAAGA